MHEISKAINRFDSKAKSSGATEYIDDIDFPGMLYATVITADRQHALITSIEKPQLPPDCHIIDRSSFSGMNRATIVAQDWPFFAEEEVMYYGQPVLLVAAPDKETLRMIARQIRINYKELPAVSNLDDAIECFNDYTIIKGNPDDEFARAARITENTYSTGMQEQAYMEPQGMIADFTDGKLTVYGSMQCPYHIKHSLANAFNLSGNSIRVVQTATGGAFGGKEDYPSILAGQVAAAAIASGKTVKLVLDRRCDMLITPKRHPSRITIRTAFDENGNITAMDIDTKLDAGAYESLSGVVLQRAIFVCSGAYNINNIRVRGRTMLTNHVPSGAFRGFGGPQALFAAEMNMYHLAEDLSIQPHVFKKNCLYKKGDRTVTGGLLREEILLEKMYETVLRESDFEKKYRDYSSGRIKGKGIGLSFAIHGGGFTGSGERDLIKSVVKLEAGRTEAAEEWTIRILVSSVEMGQGASTTLRKIVSESSGIPIHHVEFVNPDTDLVPDSGPTVASRTMMIVGALLSDAAAEIGKKIEETPPEHSAGTITVEKHYIHPPELNWNNDTFSGDAYPGYSWSVNVIEIELDRLTYEVRITGSWAVYDVGTPIDEKILRGQMQGGTAQSLAWASIERMELSDGIPAQASFTDYTIPTTLDFPETKCFFVDNTYLRGPFGAKAAGELPNEGPAAAYVQAVSQAAGVRLSDIPVTPEKLEALLYEK